MKQGQASIKGPYDRKVEPANQGVNPGAVSYLGEKLGNHATDVGDMTLQSTPWRTEGFRPPPTPTPYAPGPGGGRSVRKSGTQGEH